VNPPLAEGSPTFGDIVRDRKTILFLAIFVAIFVAIFSDFFLTGGLFYARDMAGLEIPVRQHVVSLMKEGRLPLWTEAFGNGQPLLANPKWAVFYPSTWLYLVLPFPVAFKLHFFIHAVLAWLGLYVLGRSLRLSKESAFLGAASFLLGGFYLSSFEFYNHVAAFCWLPWLLYNLRSRTPTAPRTLGALTGLWCLLILAGAPHFVPMAALFAVLAVGLAGDRKPERLAVVLLTLVAALSLSAVQLIPTAELLRGKARDPGETLRWSLEPIQLVNLAVPEFLGADRGSDTSEYWGRHLFDKDYPLYYSLYASPGLLLLALLGLTRPRDRIKIMLLASFGAFFILSTLRLFPFFSCLAKVPGIGLIRYPANYFGGSLLALSLLAALGFDACRTPSRTVRILLAWTFPLGLAAAAAFSLWPARFLLPLTRLFVISDARQIAALEGSIRYSLIATAAFSGILLAAQLEKRGARLLPGLFAGLLLLDLAVSNRGINPTAPPRFFDLPAIVSDAGRPVRVYRDPSLSDRLTDKVGSDLRYQRYLRSSLFPYTAAGPVEYVYDRDFFSLYSDDQVAVYEKLKRAKPETLRRILADARCDYAVSHESLLASGLAPLSVEGQAVYFEPVPAVRDRPYFASATVRVGSLERALALFDQADFEPATTAIVYEDLGLDARPPDEDEPAISVQEARAGKMACSLSTPRPALAVFPMRFSPGWVARLDGRRVSAFKVNLGSTGLMVPPGAHEVTIRYAPASLAWGAGLSLVTLMGLGLLAFGLGRRDGRPMKGQEPRASRGPGRQE